MYNLFLNMRLTTTPFSHMISLKKTENVKKYSNNTNEKLNSAVD